MGFRISRLLVLIAAIAIPEFCIAARSWTNLKVHFSANPLSKYYYQSMPRQLKDLRSNDWTNISTGDCTNGGKFNGFRYIENNDFGLALLFDVKGTIAGIQQILNKEELLQNNDYAFDKVPMFASDTVKGIDVYVLTAYFVDPATICTAGRDSSELSGRSGTGTELHLQNGPIPDDYIILPRSRSQAIAEGWTKNECFLGMGHHNFYKTLEQQATDCTVMRPYFGIYDKRGDMIGLGFFAFGIANSNHFEHPPASAVKAIIGRKNASQCMLDKTNSPGITSMHVFFNDFPNLFNCLLN